MQLIGLQAGSLPAPPKQTLLESLGPFNGPKERKENNYE
jgi:hypothetical protein